MNRMSLILQLGALSLHAEAVFPVGIIVVSGANGAGKTTMLRCLAGLEAASGQLVINGECWQDSTAGFFLPVERRRLGCVWAETTLLPWLDVEENLRLGRPPVDDVWRRELGEVLALEALLRRKPHMLSTGEAQRVALARALLRRPALLLLDEPFSAQAPEMRRRLRQWLGRLPTRFGMTVIMVSHDADDACVLADQHWHLREGKLLKSMDRAGHGQEQMA